MRPETILSRVYGLPPGQLPKAALVVSAGGDTLAANIATARLLGVPNIFYGSLRRYRETDFALVLTSYARHTGRARHLVTPKPNKLDPDTLPRPRGAQALGPGSPPHTAGLIVGGDAGTVHFSHTDWQRVIAFLRAQKAAQGTNWIAATSPRTPAAAADAFAALAAETDGPLAHFIYFRERGPGTLGRLFAAAEAILVTADSSSMLSESIWVRRPVIAISPENAALPGDEQDYRQFLEESGWTQALPIRDLTPETFLGTLARITPLSENPLDLLAARLADRLPQLFA
jgi:mitochondrial fission protein ELM1